MLSFADDFVMENTSPGIVRADTESTAATSDQQMSSEFTSSELKGTLQINSDEQESQGKIIPELKSPYRDFSASTEDFI